MSVLRATIDDLSEHDINLVTIYCIRGSKRAVQTGENANMPINIISDLIQVNHFEKSLHDICNDMRKKETEVLQKSQPISDSIN